MKIFILFFSLFVFCHCSHSKPNANQANSPSEAEGESGNQGQGSEETEEIVEDEEVDKTVYRFAVISDMNGSYGSKTYGSDVKKAVDYITGDAEKFDFVISTGDMVAGQKSGLDYSGMWEAFHSNVTRPILNKGIPIFPSPGNHDAYIGRETERSHYRGSWEKEDPLSKASKVQFVEGVVQNFPFQYAFYIGEALFVALDNTAAKPWKNETLNWLKEVFERSKNSEFKFVYGHVPLLPFAFSKETEYVSKGSSSFLQSAEQLFETYKVDVFFSGHSHVYYPGRRDAATEYISVPLLGSGSRYLITRGSVDGRSPKGYLAVEYSRGGGWKVESRSAKTNDPMNDLSLPEVIDLPSSNSSLCDSCTSFPSSHFLDKSKRIIYRRSDLKY